MNDNNAIVFDDWYEDEFGFVSVYFTVPLEWLSSYTREKYPEASYATVWVEYLQGSRFVENLDISISPTVVDDNSISDVDWEECDLTWKQLALILDGLMKFEEERIVDK